MNILFHGNWEKAPGVHNGFVLSKELLSCTTVGRSMKCPFTANLGAFVFLDIVCLQCAMEETEKERKVRKKVKIRKHILPV